MGPLNIGPLVYHDMHRYDLYSVSKSTSDEFGPMFLGILTEILNFLLSNTGPFIFILFSVFVETF